MTLYEREGRSALSAATTEFLEVSQGRENPTVTIQLFCSSSNLTSSSPTSAMPSPSKRSATYDFAVCTASLTSMASDSLYSLVGMIVSQCVGAMHVPGQLDPAALGGISLPAALLSFSRRRGSLPVHGGICTAMKSNGRDLTGAHLQWHNAGGGAPE